MDDDDISSANVLSPFSMLSSFESLVRSASWILPSARSATNECASSVRPVYTHLKLAYSAGTKDPHMAITVKRPIWRRYVLLPASRIRLAAWQCKKQSWQTRHTVSKINQLRSTSPKWKCHHFGPCTIWNEELSQQYTSFATRLPLAWTVSRMGCRPDLIARVPVNSGRTALPSIALSIFHNYRVFTHRSCGLNTELDYHWVTIMDDLRMDAWANDQSMSNNAIYDGRRFVIMIRDY